MQRSSLDKFVEDNFIGVDTAQDSTHTQTVMATFKVKEIENGEINEDQYDALKKDCVVNIGGLWCVMSRLIDVNCG